MKRIKMFLTVIAVTMLLSGCSFGTIEEQKTGDVIYEIVKKEEIPEQLKEEIKEERNKLTELLKNGELKKAEKALDAYFKLLAKAVNEERGMNE